MQSGAPPDTTVNPWTAIWWKPRAAINAVMSGRTPSRTFILAALIGMATVVGALALAPNLHWFAVILAAIVIGPVAGVLTLYIDGALLSWIGRPLGGSASQAALRTAVAWAAMPSIAALALTLAGVAVFGQDLLRAFSFPPNIKDPALLVLAALIVLLPVWGVVLRVGTVGAVQGFGIVRAIANIALGFLAIVVFAALFRTALFQPFSIVSSSMEPTLRLGDLVYTDKRSYGWSRYSLPFDLGFKAHIGATEPSRGDIVVFRLPGDDSVDYIKRVVGLPGDEVQMIQGELHINGAPVAKRPVGDIVVEDAAGAERAVGAYEETLPEGRKFVVLEMEENGSLDDTAAFRVTPGHYFVLGDNRDNSMDSRSLEHVGLIPAENIFARVSFVYFSAGSLPAESSPAHAFDNFRWDRFFLVPR